MKYIAHCHKTTGMELTERLVSFSELYTRDIACKALHAIIDAETDGVSLAEIEDATFRVSWIANIKDDDLSEPWPMVMLNTALEINSYFASNIQSKKTDTSADASPR
jgi:hypothetical protein